MGDIKREDRLSTTFGAGRFGVGRFSRKQVLREKGTAASISRIISEANEDIEREKGI